MSTRRKVTPPNERSGGPGSAHQGGANRGSGNHGATHPDAATLQHYQAALQLLQQAKFEKALVAFEKLLGTAPPPLAEEDQVEEDFAETAEDAVEERAEPDLSAFTLSPLL